MRTAGAEEWANPPRAAELQALISSQPQIYPLSNLGLCYEPQDAAAFNCLTESLLLHMLV